MSGGGGGAKQPTPEELAAAKAAEQKLGMPVNPVAMPSILMPQQTALLAQQMQQGGYGNANQIRGVLDAQYQDPNVGHEWFYKIINKGDDDKAKSKSLFSSSEG